MELTRPNYAVVYVILLCALAQGGSEGKGGKEEDISRDGGGALSSSIYVHGIKAENKWKHCRRELIERKNDVKYFDWHPLEGSSDIRTTKNDINEETRFLPLHIKRKSLDCFRTSTTPTPVSEKRSSRNLLSEHFGSTLGVESSHGRNLIADSPKDQMAPSPAAAAEGSPNQVRTPASSPSLPTQPSPTPSPTQSSPTQASDSPSPTQPSATPSSPTKQSPTPSSPTPTPKARDLPLPPNMLVPFPPPPPSPPRSPPQIYRPVVYALVPSPPNNEDKKKQTVIIAASVSGFIILVAMALCCREARTNKSDRDDRPLLVLTSNDYAGGSMKVVRLGNAGDAESDTDKGKNPSNVRNWSVKGGDNNIASVAETPGTTSGGAAQVPVPPSETTAPAPVPVLAAPAPGPPTPTPPGPPPPPPPKQAPPHAPRAPPPPKGVHPPPAPPKLMGGKNQGPVVSNEVGSSEADAPKAKLKPFFWDKVNAKPGQSMVWHEINSGSFVINEEMMESLFGCAQNKNERKKDSPHVDTSVHYIQIIDPRKAQNLSILLRALNVTTEEVIDALKEGNEIPVELIQTLLKMAPTSDEELKLRLFNGQLSELGPAERFLKVLVDIPFAFKRLECLMFMFMLQEEFSSMKESFATLEVASNELRKSRLFLKLLEAVLKTGNRMNDGTYRGGAQAFRLDTLLKLSDVKGTDGKTTLLHFVVEEIIRSEGIRAMRSERESRSRCSVGTDDSDEGTEETEEQYRSLGLEVVSSLSTELEEVRKAALIDGDALTNGVSKLGHSMVKTEAFLNTEMKSLEEESEFQRMMERFMESARSEVMWLVEEEKRIMALVKSTADYFHGNAGKDEGLRLFLIVRDFLIILDKVCREVKEATIKRFSNAATSTNTTKDHPTSLSCSSPDAHTPTPPSDLHRRLFPAIAERRIDYSSSSSSSSSDDDHQDF
ncbi:hypothetical protein VNO78_06000 [Psophocarpus tetragonolobus]|uniref:Formin-like protein n=1 Tax=Psophocarpus tetragonolobus TaxID=3891 RepID=A0AAN9SRT2_PSOTE